MTIRRFPDEALSLTDLVNHRTLSSDQARILKASVRGGDNILICGATGSGKSTTLAALAAEISHDSRIITIEDTAELRIDHPHVVGLETRPAGSGGKGGVTMRELVRNALRMRPDRLIVGEVRGAEALDMIDALATGHSGSLSTVHAASPGGALDRLEQLSLQATSGLSHDSVRERVWSAIDLVVFQARSDDGGRVIRSIVRTQDGRLVNCAGSGAEA
jgi:pilus assembly protein CpaF